MFSQSEKKLQKIFHCGATFFYKNESHEIITSGKPSPSKGECKTDLYIKTIDKSGVEHEIKLSIKQLNADFLENKMSAERATQIFGYDAKKIITHSLDEIATNFTDDPLILFKKQGRTEAKTIKIGWKFELLNKKSGLKSGLIDLTEEQIIDVYSGTNLPIDKKNSSIDSSEIKGSGIANTILFIDPLNNLKNIQSYVDEIQDITDYCKGKKVFFACKAINYRITKDKWDGNRPLAVWIDWHLDNDILYGEFNFSSPLQMKADVIGANIRKILSQLKITEDNFNELQNKLSSKIIIHK